MDQLTNDIAVGYAIIYTFVCIALVLIVELKAKREAS